MSRISFEFTGDVQAAMKAVKTGVTSARNITATDDQGRTVAEDGSTTQPASQVPEAQAQSASSQSARAGTGSTATVAPSATPEQAQPASSAPPNNPTAKASATGPGGSTGANPTSPSRRN